MNKERCRVLFVGESVLKIHVHYKGFASYETGYYADDIEDFTTPVEKEGVEFVFLRNHDVAALFPTRLEEINQYDVVVISDAPADSFLLHPKSLAGERVPNRFKLINDYVRNGGGFVMVGGWMAFSGFHGKAMYFSTPLTEILPVKMCTWDDRMETPEGVVPSVLIPDHPILSGIPADWPYFMGYNKTFIDKGSTIMTINDDPFLVVDSIGKGRVAIFSSDLLPHWAPKKFVQWEYYGRFWGQLFKWVAGKL